ncbi:MAG: redox-sensing transcriptional repressor Rex [Elusimicrobiota bacterium]|jgi:redox-sensing transcriptional repressor|nr:redox-sensing transcriptional repressor Rex [Elusimicrobiota bacterium]
MTYKVIENINAVQENIITKPAPEPTVRRLLVYLEYLKSIDMPLISSGQIAEHFNFTAIQVRKDISFSGYIGRPKHGYNREQLIEQIEKFLGFNDKIDVFLIGAGNIGRALAEYKGFEKYSLNIIALADNNPELYNTTVAGKKIFSLEKALELIKRLKIKMAIIAVPPPANQTVADLLIKAGIKAIWNFSSARLKCPDEIIVQNEDLGASLSVLAQKLLSAEQTKHK